MQSIIDYWKNVDLNNKPFIHDDDKKHLEDKQLHGFKSIEHFYTNDYLANPYLFHTDLVPTPYMGDLKNANIFILMLNPGLSFDDYHAENQSEDFKTAIKNNLTQECINKDFPFLFTNPQFLWHSGGLYWLKKFKSHILNLKKKRGLTIAESTEIVSRKIAVLQMYPYHSTQFKTNKKIKKLPSALKMQAFVKETVIPRASRDEICIICARKSDEWDIQGSDNIIVYKGHESRAAHLSEKTRAFPVIERFLNK